MSEKLIVKVDSQILNSMNLCPERYRLEMVEHWRPQAKAAALEKGSVMHKMLDHYRIGKRDNRCTKDTHGALVSECIIVGRTAAANTYHIDMDMLEEELTCFKDYVLRWQYDGWEVIDVEQPFTKLLYDDNTPFLFCELEYSGLTILYEGIIDARIRDPKIGIAVVDSKTESRKSYPYILSNQFQGYEWAFGVPVIVDKIGFQTSLKPQEKFRRLVHESGAPAIQEWVGDAISIVKEAIGWHEIIWSGGRLRKNRTSCDKYSGCVFQKVCAAPNEVREFKLQAYFYKDKQWDPYTRDTEDELVEVE